MAAVGLAILIGIMASAPVSAHSFLVRTDPPHGARLSHPPGSVALQFTEPVVVGSAALSVRTVAGDAVQAAPPAPEASGSALRVGLAGLGYGTFVVSWHAVSAVDGHQSAGEFAFAVGEGASMPPAAQETAADDGVGAVLRWLFFLGLALGSGGLATAWRERTPVDRRATWVRIGLVTAAAVAAAEYLLSLSTVGLSPSAIAAGTAASLLLLATALSGRSTRTSLVIVGLVAIAWAARSHPGAAAGVAGVVADAAHLAGGAVWTGMLMFLVLDLWRGRQGEPVLGIARRYARVALWVVILVAGAGLLSAIAVLGSVSDLWSTSYGRLIVLKVALFLAAVTLAAAARSCGLAAARVRLLRTLATIEVVVLAAILVVTAVLTGLGPPALARADAASLLGPEPMEGVVARAAGLAGEMTVGIAAGDGRIDVQVYDDAVGGVDDAALHLAAELPDGTGLELHPRECGAGCFTQRLDLPNGPTVFTATADSVEWQGGSVELPIHWPPALAERRLLDAVTSEMREVDRLTLTETTRSGPGAQRTTTISLSGSEFMDLELYGRGTVDELIGLPGKPFDLGLYLPGSRILIELQLDEQMRIAEERIVSPKHEITRTFEYMDDGDRQPLAPGKVGLRVSG